MPYTMYHMPYAIYAACLLAVCLSACIGGEHVLKSTNTHILMVLLFLLVWSFRNTHILMVLFVLLVLRALTILQAPPKREKMSGLEKQII